MDEKTLVLTRSGTSYIACQADDEKHKLDNCVDVVIVDGGGDYSGFYASAQFIGYVDGISFKINDPEVFSIVLSAYLSGKPIKIFIEQWKVNLSGDEHRLESGWHG